MLPLSWEKSNDIWFNYVKGHNPKAYFGIYDVVRFDTFWLDRADVRFGPGWKFENVAARIRFRL